MSSHLSLSPSFPCSLRLVLGGIGLGTEPYMLVSREATLTATAFIILTPLHLWLVFGAACLTSGLEFSLCMHACNMTGWFVCGWNKTSVMTKQIFLVI